MSEWRNAVLDFAAWLWQALWVTVKGVYNNQKPQCETMSRAKNRKNLQEWIRVWPAPQWVSVCLKYRSAASFTTRSSLRWCWKGSFVPAECKKASWPSIFSLAVGLTALCVYWQALRILWRYYNSPERKTFSIQGEPSWGTGLRNRPHPSN